MAAAFAILAGMAAPAVAGSYSLAGRFKGPDGGYDYISFDPAHGRVYVGRTDGVLSLDPATGTVIGHLASAQHSHAVLPLPERYNAP